MFEKRILPNANIFSDEFKKPEGERWNLKEDPYVAAKRHLEEAKKKPQPLRGTGKLALMVLEWVSHGSEGSLPKGEFTSSSGVEDSSILKPEEAKTTQPVPKQQEDQPKIPQKTLLPIDSSVSPNTDQEASKTPPRIFPLLDLLFLKTEPVSSKTNFASSREPPKSSDETQIQTEGSHIKRVAVE